MKHVLYTAAVNIIGISSVRIDSHIFLYRVVFFYRNKVRGYINDFSNKLRANYRNVLEDIICKDETIQSVCDSFFTIGYFPFPWLQNLLAPTLHASMIFLHFRVCFSFLSTLVTRITSWTCQSSTLWLCLAGKWPRHYFWLLDTSCIYSKLWKLVYRDHYRRVYSPLHFLGVSRTFLDLYAHMSFNEFVLQYVASRFCMLSHSIGLCRSLPVLPDRCAQNPSEHKVVYMWLHENI